MKRTDKLIKSFYLIPALAVVLTASGISARADDPDPAKAPCTDGTQATCKAPSVREATLQGAEVQVLQLEHQKGMSDDLDRRVTAPGSDYSAAAPVIGHLCQRYFDSQKNTAPSDSEWHVCASMMNKVYTAVHSETELSYRLNQDAANHELDPNGTSKFFNLPTDGTKEDELAPVIFRPDSVKTIAEKYERRDEYGDRDSEGKPIERTYRNPRKGFHDEEIRTNSWKQANLAFLNTYLKVGVDHEAYVRTRKVASDPSDPTSLDRVEVVMENGHVAYDEPKYNQAVKKAGGKEATFSDSEKKVFEAIFVQEPKHPAAKFTASGGGLTSQRFVKHYEYAGGTASNVSRRIYNQQRHRIIEATREGLAKLGVSAQVTGARGPAASRVGPQGPQGSRQAQLQPKKPDNAFDPENNEEKLEIPQEANAKVRNFTLGLSDDALGKELQDLQGHLGDF